MGAALTVAPSVAMADTPDLTLLARPETHAALGPLADHLPRWADMNVMVISQDDMFRLGGDRMNADTTVLRNLFNKFAATIPAFPADRVVREDLGRLIARTALDAAPSAYPLAKRSANEEDICVITLPYLDDRARRSIVRRLSSLSLADGTDIPGTADDWRMIVLAHEARHCRHSFADQSDLAAMNFEREADQYAVDIYQREAQTILGPHRDPLAVPQALLDFRAINMLMGAHNYHATSPGVTLLPTHAAVTSDAQSLLDGAVATRQALYNQAAHGDPAEHSRRRPRPPEMFAAAQSLNISGLFTHQPVQQQYITHFLRGGARYFPNVFTPG
ncbi:MAG: hypothetical protein KJ667_07055 [Alphaproteobacteria bacterium]|nr:hypothetical protein [Alphaproteobacteria bacterium]